MNSKSKTNFMSRSDISSCSWSWPISIRGTSPLKVASAILMFEILKSTVKLSKLIC